MYCLLLQFYAQVVNLVTTRSVLSIGGFWRELLYPFINLANLTNVYNFTPVLTNVINFTPAGHDQLYFCEGSCFIE